MRATPSRISPTTYPIAATATARAYDLQPQEQTSAEVSPANHFPDPGQQPLFTVPVNNPRVIPFDSLTSGAEREAIHTRVADIRQSDSIKNARVDSRRTRPKRGETPDQHRLEFFGQEEIIAKPQSHVICDAPVAPASLRIQAALIDGIITLAGLSIGVALFLYEGGTFSANKHTLPFLAAALATVPLFYKLLWVLAGRDSIGTQLAGLELVDFDGKRPSQERRFQRLAGSILSLLAAGVGVVWALLDEDNLTWHDHMSSTFPTLASGD